MQPTLMAQSICKDIFSKAEYTCFTSGVGSLADPRVWNAMQGSSILSSLTNLVYGGRSLVAKTPPCEGGEHGAIPCDYPKQQRDILTAE